ncbi:MAG: hypothetical protein OXP08_01835 [bacterium]|nr:hypothetical protein [bacterium]
MTAVRRSDSVNWWVLPWWVLASAVGFAVGGLIEAAAGPLEGVAVLGYVTAGGAAAAVLQWPVLRRHVARAGRWVGAGIVGGAVVGVAAIALGVLAGLGAGAVGDAEAGRAFGEDVAGVSAAVLYGTAVGMLQGRLLRPRFARAGRWLLASAVGWIVAGLTAGVTEGIAGWAVLGAVYGAITGGVLVALLRQRPEETPAGE